MKFLPANRLYWYLMDDMPPPLQKLLRSARQKHFPKGQIILYEGDIPSEVYVIKDGAVKLYDIDDQGNEKILHIVKSPALLPFAFFSGGTEPIRWFYTALTDCDAYVLSEPKLLHNLQTDGTLAVALINSFSNDVHELLTRLSSLEKTNARGKLTAALKFLAARHAKARRSGWWRVHFPVSHQLMADMSGITRESTAVVMKDLQDEKIVRSPRITILEINRQKLFDT